MKGVFSAVVLLASLSASAAIGPSYESPRSGVIEVKLGGYRPFVDRTAGLDGATPYASTFGNKAMLLGEIEYDHMLYQQLGSLGFGLSIGYAEKYGRATVVGTGEPAAESTSLKVLPLRLLGVYRFDYGALHYGIPFTPFVKAGLVYAPFWATTGAGIENASGGQWGYMFSGGIGFMLDFIDPRIQRDFDSEMGVNHTYVFAEYTLEEINDFGTGGLDLSSRRLSIGLAFDF